MFRTLRAALLITGTDLKRRLRSRSFVIQAFVGPLVLATVISAAFAGGFGVDVTVGLVTEDDSGLATALERRLVSGTADGVEVVPVADRRAARRAIADEDIGAAIVIPAGFEASLAGPSPMSVDLMTDDGSVVSGAVARAVANAFVARVNAGRLAAIALVAAGQPVPDAAALQDVDLPIALDQVAAGDEISPAASVGPGMGLLFLFLTVGLVARSLLEERRQRVLDRIRVAPVSSRALLLGKALGVVVIGCVSLFTLWGATTVLLGADWGDPLGVVALIVAASVMVAGLSGLVAALAATEQSADLIATMFAFVFGILGGSLVPLSELPDGLLRLSMLTPNGWVLRGFADLSAGGGHLADVLPEIGVLMIWTVVGGGIGAALLPRRLVAR